MFEKSALDKDARNNRQAACGPAQEVGQSKGDGAILALATAPDL
jgi:hypothetical protein